VGGSSVDSLLYLIKRGLKSALVLLKVDVDLEEGLELSLVLALSAADSFLHLVQ
jgi:hypothetical protein